MNSGLEEMSQVSMAVPRCDECGQQCCDCEEPSVPSSAEQDEEEDVHPLKRADATVGFKEPWFTQQQLWENDPVEAEPADLGAFFERHGVDHWDSIRLCRTYANYQAAKKIRPPKKAKK